MAGQPVIPKGAPPPLAPYSPGYKAGDTVYTCGVLALDPNGTLIGVGDVALQTRTVLNSIQNILKAAGATLQDVVMNQIYLKDLGDYAAMNKVYAEYFPKNPPARLCVGVALVKPEFLVEIAAIAVISKKTRKAAPKRKARRRRR
jgi:aminoacrylate peracid reductase